MDADRPETSKDEEIVEAAAADVNAETGPAEEAQAPADTIYQPETPRRSWFGSVMNFLFSTETAVGRGMRRTLRWTAFVLILFAAGALAMYFWRVHPTEQILAQTAAQLVAVQSEIDGARNQVADSQAEMSAMQERLQAAESTSQAATQRLLLTTLRNDIAAARVALVADKDVAAIVSVFDGAFDHWHLGGLESANARGLSAALLNERIATLLTAPATIHRDIGTALDAATAAAGKGDRIVAFGSFHVAAQALRVFERDRYVIRDAAAESDLRL